MIVGAAAEVAKNLLRNESWQADELAADRNQHDYIYVLPPWPQKTDNELSIILGEHHYNTKPGYVKNPEWCIIPEDGLYGNIAAFGGIGTGKTAGAAYPMVEQFFEYCPDQQDLKFGGLILDVKGDFVKQVTQYAEKYFRSQDVIKVRPGGEHTWNPIHNPSVDAEVIAGRLVAVYENMTGGTDQKGQWIVDGILKLLTHGIGMHRLAYGYVTIKDINSLILTMNTDKNAEDDPISRLLAEYTDSFELRLDNGNVEPDTQDDFQYHLEFWESWKKENGDNKATVSGACQNVTGLFSKPSVAKTFCPEEAKISFPGFGKIIDEGWIVCLDMPDSEFGVVASAIGIMLKQEFQRASLSRVSRASLNPATNTKRPLLFCCDEYQNFCTVSSQRVKDGDDNFYALSRQSRCVSLVLTQSPISLIAKLGKEKSRVILASLRTKIFLAITDYEDQELAANIMGKDWIAKKEVTYGESAQNTSYDVITDSMGGDSSGVTESLAYRKQMTHRVDPVQIASLRTFEGFCYVFDGVQQQPPKRIYLKTYFCPDQFREQGYSPRTLPYKLLIDSITNNAKTKKG
nr:type IV secretion system DNA-binding domain-containing protein [uncultured Desulfobacter sp.]